MIYVRRNIVYYRVLATGHGLIGLGSDCREALLQCERVAKRRRRYSIKEHFCGDNKAKSAGGYTREEYQCVVVVYQ